ncbi:rhamnan synthesis F family protein [Neorhizobium sp. AL 9.2.2]|uniref:rhamnan synthesis F family protein n=1 Tax=Neorhizobium sp. AL 9.2.2 TaxID=2712894 RepID=UPI00157485F8|nr:rhamnan synthesis F family protein [Neorhizobium sp. AL 9.2.2]NSY19762.1 hypothetical protein [Neorhizobium sp. AL 9.2.2]
MRLGIFLFYDGEGHVSDHTVYLLAKFSEHLDRLIVVANGPIRAGDDARIAHYADQILVRNNTGFDVGGYIDGIMSVGFDDLADYDELVLFNYTVFGPMFDLAEMFSEMGKRDVDFWGVTEFRDRNKEFLQSYFLVTRKRLHASQDFRDYWLNMPKIEAVNDSVELHEFRFTPHFVERGYRKGVYIENEASWQGNTTLLELEALLAKRLPIVKYRAFNFDASAIERRGGVAPALNYALIAEKTEYPVDFIWDYILSQTSVDQIIDSITRVAIAEQTLPADTGPEAFQRAVVFLSVEDVSCLERVASYFAAYDSRKLFVVSSREEICQFFESRGWTTQHSAVPMTGAPICAFADRLATFVSEDDVVFNLSCFFQERDNYRFREFLIENYWDPLLSSPGTIGMVSDTFRTTPRIGLMFAPTESVFGRTTRFEPLCPRASNWTFDDYPPEVRRALNQANWPWRGNAAFSATLVLDQTFIAALIALNAQVKRGNFARITGIEGVIAELARRAGYAPKLAVSQPQAIKLLARGTLKARDFRDSLQKQALAFAEEVAVLRGEVAEAKADAVPGKQDKPGKADPGKAPAPADMKPDAASPDLPAVIARAEKRANAAEAALERSNRLLEEQSAKWETLLANLTPQVLRSAVAIERGNAAVVIVSPAGEGADVRSVASPTFPVLGAIDVLRHQPHRVQIKGWTYHGERLSEMTFVAVALGDRIIKSFRPSILQRNSLGSKIGMNLPHEHCGFALTVPLPENRSGLDTLSLLVSSGEGDQICIAPLVEGPIASVAPQSPVGAVEAAATEEPPAEAVDETRLDGAHVERPHVAETA